MPRNTTLYGIAGTNTFRLNSQQWSLDYVEGYSVGGNLQNIEKSVRKMYKADQGYILNQRDQSGAEALIVAYLCEHGRFRDLFLNGVKPHVFVALHLFAEEWQREIDKQTTGDLKCSIQELVNTPIADLKKNPWWKDVDKLIKSSDNWPAQRRFYYIGKQVCHSSNYGIKAGRFCLNTLEKSRGKIVLQKKDAERFLELYHSLFPEIREWHKIVQRQIRETRYLYNLFGHPRYFGGDITQEQESKDWYAFVPQSTVAMITRIAVPKMQSFIESTHVNWDILQDNHDSFVVQCPVGEELDCQKIMKQFIEPELTSPRGEKFRMKSEGASGYNWAPYDEKKNPEGLKEVGI